MERCAIGRGGSGFTLIELVISSALMSMILVSAYLCLKGGIESQKLIESRQEVLQSARVAMAIMSADLRGACSLSKEFEFLGMHRMLGDTEADNLDFATHNYTPRRPHEGDWCEVSYFLDKSPEDGALNLWRRRDPTPDTEPLSGGSREEIARALRGLKFEYYDGFDWFDEWGDPQGRRKGRDSLVDPGNLSGLPEAVRITLWFDPNPTSKPAAQASTKEDNAELPLVFQTVVRLNLSASLARGSSSSSSGSSFDSSAGQANQGAGNEGRQ